MRHIGLAVSPFVLFLASGAQAVTYIVPPDREMIQMSDDIVIATGVTSLVERNEHGGIVTRYTLRIEDVLKGRRHGGDHLVLTELGGLLDDRIKYFPGTPEYQPGVRYLVFTESDRDGQPVTFGVALGQFFFATHEGRSTVVRAEIFGFNHNLDPNVESARDTEGFVEYIRGIVAQSNIDPEPRYFVPRANPRHVESDSFNVVTDATRSSYLVQASGRAFRWETPSTSMVKSGTAVGVDGEAAVALTFSQWNGTASNINYTDGGVDNSAVGGLSVDDGKNTILFNDPNNEVGAGIAGRGGVSSGGGPYNFEGEDFWNIFEIDAVMNNGTFAQNCFNTVMVHEIGHTLAFRHSNEPPSGGESTTDAVMNSIVQCSWNGVLKTYDHTAASTVYGPVTGTIPAAPAQLIATANGASQVALTWQAADGALSYDVYRSVNDAAFTFLASSGVTSLNDNAVAADTTYLYQVRAVGSGGPGPFSAIDPATTIAFTDDPLVPGTPIKIAHFAQLRTAVNAMRAAAGLPPQTFTDEISSTTPIRALHMNELRSALSAARSEIGLPAASYTDDPVTAGGTGIKAAHQTEVRNGVK